MANVTVGTARWLSQTDGIIPEATGQAISYIRRPDKFKVNRYTQLIESPGTVGYYYYIDRDTPARVVADADFALWVDGSERPIQNDNGLTFAIANFTTNRRNYATMLGNQAIDMGSKGWNVKAHLEGTLLQQCMTNRTNRIIGQLETVGNWGANTADANTLNSGAGTWVTASDQPASSNYNAIKKSILAALNKITLATNATVQPDDLVLVVSPGLAQVMSSSAEIHNYVRNGPFSLSRLEDKGLYGNDRWGLPTTLYGLELVVEDTVRVTDRAAVGGGILGSASTNRVYAKGDTSAVIVSRKGGIDGNYGAPSFSTIQYYWYEYLLAVYTFADAKNQRTEFHVSEQAIEILAAPETGFFITTCQ
jgi:hypothetical protein